MEKMGLDLFKNKSNGLSFGDYSTYYDVLRFAHFQGFITIDEMQEIFSRHNDEME